MGANPISDIWCEKAIKRFLPRAARDGHDEEARWMGVPTRGADAASAAKALSDAFIGFMQAIGLPNGLQAVGCDSADIAAHGLDPHPQYPPAPPGAFI